MKSQDPTREQPLMETSGLQRTETTIPERPAEEGAPWRGLKERGDTPFLMSPVPMAIATMAEDRYVEVNRAFLKTTGFPRDEVIGKTPVEIGFMTREDRDMVDRVLDEKGGVENIEVRVFTKDGGARYALFGAALTAIRNESYRLFTMTDITDLKTREQTLEEERAAYLGILENSLIGTFQTTPEGRLLNANPVTARVLGYDSPEEFMTSVTDIPNQLYVDPQDRQRFTDFCEGRGRLLTYEVLLYRKDGSKIWASLSARTVRDEDGKVLYYEGTAEDITNRKLAEDALRESEEKFRLLFEKSVDPILLQDVDDYSFVDCNESALRIMGCTSKDQLVGLHAFDISPERQPDGRLTREKVRELNSLASKNGHVHFEWLHRTMNGESLWVLVSLTMVPIKGKSIAYVIWTDITERKKAEEALKESEERYRNIFESAVEGIFQAAPDGYLISVNPAFAAMHGYSSPEEMKEAITDIRNQVFLRPEEGDRLRDLCKEHGFVSNFDARCFRKDGQIIWTSTSARAVRGAKGETLYYEGFVEDITARKEAEKILEKERETFFTILENDPTGVALIDRHGAYRYINPELTRTTGYTIKDIPTGRDWLEKAYPDPLYREKVIETWKGDRARERGQWMDREFTVTCKDGKTRDIDMRTTFMDDFTITVLRDVTEKRQSEKALRESEEKYRSVVEDSLVGYYIVRDNLFLFVNKRFCDIFGYAREEIILKKGPMDLTHPDDREKVAENIRKRISGEADHIEYDFVAFRKDGKAISVKVLGSSIVYQGQIAGTGSIIDITAEKELEGKLRQAQKMEALGTLAGGIAHDFNNILTVLTGYGTLLRMETEEADCHRIYADQILSASTKAAQLTKSLLAFSRQQSIALSPLRINDVIIGTEKLLKRLITEDITLLTDLFPGDIIVMADATQIDQILFNLATNARDAMPKGGTLSIRTEIVAVDPAFAEIHGLGKPGKYVLLSVSDTGAGMDRSTREHIFDPFFTTKEIGKGTGLGLSTVYGIVKQHDGYINVYSEPEKGTTFHIYLPAVTVPSAEDTPPLPDLRGGTETILLAEDDETVRSIMSTILKTYGYPVIVAGSGVDAVREFIGNAGVDLVILDSVMPGMNGREAYEEIKRIKPDMKALFISGHTRDVILDKGIKEKELNFLSKPVSPWALLRTVRDILDS